MLPFCVFKGPVLGSRFSCARVKTKVAYCKLVASVDNRVIAMSASTEIELVGIRAALIPGIKT
jgi:hypothetical protein